MELSDGAGGGRGDGKGEQTERDREGECVVKIGSFSSVTEADSQGSPTMEGAAQECVSSFKEAEAPPKGEGRVPRMMCIIAELSCKTGSQC